MKMSHKESIAFGLTFCVCIIIVIISLVYGLDFHEINSHNQTDIVMIDNIDEEKQDVNDNTVTKSTDNENIIDDDNNWTKLGKYTVCAFSEQKQLSNGEYLKEGDAISADIPVGTKIFIVGAGYFTIVDSGTEPREIKFFVSRRISLVEFGIEELMVFKIN